MFELGLIERTTIKENPEFTRLHPTEWPCRIVVTGRNGERKVAEARYFKGHARRPLTDAEVERKFRSLAAKLLTPRQIDAFLAKAWALEELSDIGERAGRRLLYRFASSSRAAVSTRAPAARSSGLAFSASL